MKKRENIMFKTFKKNIFRSPYQSLAVILNVSLALFLVCTFFLIGAGSKAILDFFESRPAAIAYLKDGIKSQDVDLLKSKIMSTGKVKEANFISKDDALKIYKDLFKDKPILLEMVTANFLPASLEISTNDISSLKEIAEILKKETIVEDVDFQEDVVSTLSSWLGSLRKFGFVMAVFLLFNCLLTILVVLGMRISKRREEIEILKLLGASSWHIRSPIYLEGIFYGLFSAVVSWGLCYLLVSSLTPFLSQALAGIPIFPVSPIFMLEILGGISFLGIFVGFLGSFIAASRFLRVSR